MDNEFTRRLNQEGNKAIANYLEAIFHSLEEIKARLPKKVEKTDETVKPK